MRRMNLSILTLESLLIMHIEKQRNIDCQLTIEQKLAIE